MTARRKAATKNRVTKKRALVGWRKNLPQIRFGILTLFVVVFALGSLSAQLWAYHNTQIPQVVRDAVIAIVAHQKSGGTIAVVADFNKSQFYDKAETWGIETNSKWLADYSTRIVPYFLRERVGQGIYPDYIVVRPWLGDKSFNVGGQAECGYDTTLGRDICIVWINSRYFDDPAWQDSRDILGTFIHELVHIQGGNFINPEGGTWAEKSAILESNTSAVTLEVLAAMCQYGDELSCKTFWRELEALARQSLRARLHGDEWAYNLFSNIFLRNGIDERIARKNDRYWAGHEYERDEIIEKYGKSPYEHILRYLKFGTRLDAGTRVAYDEKGAFQLLTVPFDDSADLLGGWRIWLIVLTP